MANMTLSIPDKLYRKMKELTEIKWSEIARKAFEQRIEDLEVMNKIVAKSKLSAEDVEELSKKIKRSASTRFL